MFEIGHVFDLCRLVSPICASQDEPRSIMFLYYHAKLSLFHMTAAA